jgi:hypothetical protein
MRIPFFWAMTLCQRVIGSDYPLTQCHMPEERSAQLRRSENFETRIVCIGCSYNVFIVVFEVVLFGFEEAA